MLRRLPFLLAAALSAAAAPEHWLRYDQPAGKWVEALPVGNGRLGAMVFGGPASERLQLNALKQQLHHQHQHPDELLAGRGRQPRRVPSAPL